MARLARAMPHRPIITGFVPPPLPIIPPPSIIHSAAKSAAWRYQQKPKRAITPQYNVPPSSPYIFHSTKLDTERRYRTLPKRAITPPFVEPPKPTIIVHSQAKDAARREAKPRRHILNTPFTVPPSSPNVIRSQAKETARRLSGPRKHILPLPFVTPVVYISPVVTFVIHSQAKTEARRQSGPRHRPFIAPPALPQATQPFAKVAFIHSQAKDIARRYATRVRQTVISHYIPVVGTVGHDQNQFYWGRLARGMYLNVILNIEQLPDAIPTVTFWKEGTTAVETLSMPRIRAATRTFRLVKLLDTDYDDGHYAAVMRFEIDGTIFCTVGYFEVAGGTGDAPNIALQEIDRAAGRGVVSQSNAGNMSLGYKPKKLLP